MDIVSPPPFTRRRNGKCRVDESQQANEAKGGKDRDREKTENVSIYYKCNCLKVQKIRWKIDPVFYVGAETERERLSRFSRGRVKRARFRMHNHAFFGVLFFTSSKFGYFLADSFKFQRKKQKNTQPTGLYM